MSKTNQYGIRHDLSDPWVVLDYYHDTTGVELATALTFDEAARIALPLRSTLVLSRTQADARHAEKRRWFPVPLEPGEFAGRVLGRPDVHLSRSGRTVTARDDLVEAIRVASFESPKADSHTEWAQRINAAVDVYESAVKVEPPAFTFTPTSDPYGWLVNGGFSVHDFEGDPVFEGKRAEYKWGAYVTGGDWLIGFESRETAALAGWQAICRTADG